jgi:hypothetical protein
MREHSRIHVIFGITVVGAIASAAVGVAPAAHAQRVTPTLGALIMRMGNQDRIDVVGQGFTPGATAQVIVTSAATGAVLASSTVQTDTGITVPLNVPFAACGDRGLAAPAPPTMTVVKSCGCTPGRRAESDQAATCLHTFGAITLHTLGGAFTTSILVAAPSGAASETVRAIDTTTATASNVVTLTLS